MISRMNEFLKFWSSFMRSFISTSCRTALQNFKCFTLII